MNPQTKQSREVSADGYLLRKLTILKEEDEWRRDITASISHGFFVMIFEDKRKLLELYNAVSGKHYEDPELLEINTLENAIYMSMRNDLSFLIDAQLSLYEHQSTYSPNLPLRFLLYLADLLSGMTRDENLYGRKKVEIPPPDSLYFTMERRSSRTERS